jgi:hypothetical protein
MPTIYPYSFREGSWLQEYAKYVLNSVSSTCNAVLIAEWSHNMIVRADPLSFREARLFYLALPNVAPIASGASYYY